MEYNARGSKTWTGTVTVKHMRGTEIRLAGCSVNAFQYLVSKRLLLSLVPAGLNTRISHFNGMAISAVFFLSKAKQLLYEVSETDTASIGYLLPIVCSSIQNERQKLIWLYDRR